MTANLFTALTIALTSLKQRLNPYIQDSFNRLSTNRLLHSQSWQVTHLEVIRSMVSIIQYQKPKLKINGSAFVLNVFLFVEIWLKQCQ